jgi:hypothetical protein
MLRSLALTLLLVGSNVIVSAQACDKCCGVHILQEVNHRSCTWSGTDGWCHVSECDANGGTGSCCWSGFDLLNDVCTSLDAIDFGYHGCYEG